jgi:hypothetical protein
MESLTIRSKFDLKSLQDLASLFFPAYFSSVSKGLLRTRESKDYLSSLSMQSSVSVWRTNQSSLHFGCLFNYFQECLEC